MRWKWNILNRNWMRIFIALSYFISILTFFSLKSPHPSSSVPDVVVESPCSWERSHFRPHIWVESRRGIYTYRVLGNPISLQIKKHSRSPPLIPFTLAIEFSLGNPRSVMLFHRCIGCIDSCEAPSTQFLLERSSSFEILLAVWPSSSTDTLITRPCGK